METKTLKNKDSILLKEVKLATTFLERFMGLMGQKNIGFKESIVFANCNSIHTFFMRESIDVIFVSAQGVVIKIFDSLGPWKLLLPQRGAAHCIELPSKGSQQLGIREGDLIICEGVFG